jgi:hypothetical protein
MAGELQFHSHVPAMSDESIAKVQAVENYSAKELPQIDIDTLHVIHGGMYSRTVLIPAGVLITGALIKIATLLIIQGDVLVYIGDKTIELSGYNVLPASSHRKQAFLAKTDTHLTMIFPSDASTIEEAETQFTDEVDALMSRKNSLGNKIIITGE